MRGLLRRRSNHLPGLQVHEAGPGRACEVIMHEPVGCAVSFVFPKGTSVPEARESSTQIIRREQLRRVFFIQTLLGVLVVTGCNGGRNSALHPPLSMPTVSISLRPTTVEAGEIARLSWSSTNARSCTASGVWSGAEGLSGSENVTSAVPGRYTYTLTCAGNSGNASGSASLIVKPCQRCEVQPKRGL
jgi:hypothetical protein